MQQITQNKSIANISESSLIDGLCKGNKEMVAVLYDRYGPVVYGMISKVVKDDHQKDDLVCNCIITISLSIKTYDASKESFTLWLCKITRQIILEHLEILKQSEKDAIQKEENLVGTNVDQLTRLIEEDKLSSFELIWHYGYTYHKVAEKLGVSVAVLKKQVRTELQKNKKGKTS